jgi:hypothetical protein
MTIDDGADGSESEAGLLGNARSDVPALWSLST